jgi:hypothetical protein
MRQMANHEMKNLSQVDSGLAIAPCKVELIMVASSWREVLQAENDQSPSGGPLQARRKVQQTAAKT